MTDRRSVAVVVLAVGLLAVAAASGGAAAAEYDDPESVCAGADAEAFVLLPNGHVVDDGEAFGLLPDTDLRVVLCDDGSPVSTDQWSLADADGLSAAEAGDDYVQLATTSVESSTTIDVAALVEGQDALDVTGPEIEVVIPPTVETDRYDNVSQLVFADEDEAETFTTARDDYDDAVEEARDLESAFEEGAETGDYAAADEEVKAVNETLEELEERNDEVVRTLFAAEMNGAAHAESENERSESLVTAMEGQRDHNAEVQADVRASLERYVEAVEAEARSDRLWITGALLGPFAVTGLVGALLGNWQAKRTLKQVTRQRRRQASVDYSLANLKLAIGVGVAVLIVSLGLLVATGVAWPLFEVIL